MTNKSLAEIFSDALLKVKQSPGSYFSKYDVFGVISELQEQMEDSNPETVDSDLPKALRVGAISKIRKEVKRIIKEELEDFEPTAEDISIVSDSRKENTFELKVDIEPIQLDRILEGIDFQVQHSLENMKDTLFE